MTTITIPKQLAGEDLVCVAKEEYETLPERARFSPPTHYKTVRMTKAQKHALEQARQNLARGNFLTFDEFGKKLGIRK